MPFTCLRAGDRFEVDYSASGDEHGDKWDIDGADSDEVFNIGVYDVDVVSRRTQNVLGLLKYMPKTDCLPELKPKAIGYKDTEKLVQAKRLQEHQIE